MPRALLIGINYEGTDSALSGCINDTTNMKLVLVERGYSPENILVITDHTDLKPTRSTILMELLKLILSGDKRLFFHYSGHGSYISDVDGDEDDGRDECLVPIDYETNGMIIDDEIRGILCCLQEDQKLTCVIDACHSGTSFDLRYNLYERYSGKILSMKDDGVHPETRGQCIMLSGCMDTQTSSDSSFAGKAQGAMTYAFLKSLENSAVTYEDLLRSIRKILKGDGFSQIPNISSGKNLVLSTRVVL